MSILRADTPLTPLRGLALFAFCLATVLLVPLEAFAWGIPVWLVSLGAALRVRETAFRRRMGVLLLCIAILAVAPIHTDTSPGHFLSLGLPFLAVILIPALLLGRLDPGVIRYRFWPKRFRWADLFYVGISIPLAWGIIGWYFQYNRYMPYQWPLPVQPDDAAIHRLFWGINAVGIWDELFFVNTVYAVLRSLFRRHVANVAQAVVYTSVLNHMAFTGVGPLLVYGFALTQGSMFEESENLLYVLIVHLIVDYFLFTSIVAGQYEGWTPALLFH